jgi:hypothetical protein
MKECSATENILFDESKMEQVKKPHGNKGKPRTDKQLEGLRKGVEAMKLKREQNEKKKEEDKKRRKEEFEKMRHQRKLVEEFGSDDDEEEPLIPVEPPVPATEPKPHTQTPAPLPAPVPLTDFVENNIPVPPKKEQNYATKDDIQTLRQLLEQLRPVEKEVIKEVMIDRPVEKEVIKEKVVYLSGSQLLDKLFLSNPVETHTDRLRQMISRK